MIPSIVDLHVKTNDRPMFNNQAFRDVGETERIKRRQIRS
jgi:hypothetical protein